MGAFLLMDTLRLMARTESDTFFRKVNSVVLISPDIDIDVFRKEAEPILARGVKIYVLVSKDDRALKSPPAFVANTRASGPSKASKNWEGFR